MQPKGRAADVVHATSSRWMFLSFIDIFDARIRRIATRTSEASPIITVVHPCARGAGPRDVEARAIRLTFHEDENNSTRNPSDLSAERGKPEVVDVRRSRLPCRARMGGPDLLPSGGCSSIHHRNI